MDFWQPICPRQIAIATKYQTIDGFRDVTFSFPPCEQTSNVRRQYFQGVPNDCFIRFFVIEYLLYIINIILFVQSNCNISLVGPCKNNVEIIFYKFISMFN